MENQCCVPFQCFQTSELVVVYAHCADHVSGFTARHSRQSLFNIGQQLKMINVTK